MSLLGRASARILAKTLERAVIGLMAPFDAKHLQIMVDHDWYIIETIRWTAHHQPVYPPEVTEEDMRRIETMRSRAIRMALAALGASRTIVSRFPKPLVEQYLNVEYAFKWLREKRLDLLPVLETGEGRRWLENEVERDIKSYLWPHVNPSSLIKQREGGEGNADH